MGVAKAEKELRDKNQEGLAREWNPFFCSQLGVVLICGGNPDDAAAVANIWEEPDCHCCWSFTDSERSLPMRPPLLLLGNWICKIRPPKK